MIQRAIATNALEQFASTLSTNRTPQLFGHGSGFSLPLVCNVSNSATNRACSERFVRNEKGVGASRTLQELAAIISGTIGASGRESDAERIREALEKSVSHKWLGRVVNGDPGGDRTRGPRIKSPLLYL